MFEQSFAFEPLFGFLKKEKHFIYLSTFKILKCIYRFAFKALAGFLK